jgi:hypothetical protein
MIMICSTNSRLQYRQPHCRSDSVAIQALEIYTIIVPSEQQGLLALSFVLSMSTGMSFGSRKTSCSFIL